jgi:hypothetical protein
MTKARDLSQVPNASLGFKNRIINGQMQIDQRNNGATVNQTVAYPVDRFYQIMVGGGVLTSQRSTTAPAGFTNSILATVSTADASIASGDYYGIGHRIEGFNTADFGWGTANAQTITLSFWVSSSVTGTYSVTLYNSAGTRSYISTYVVNAANTWEQKSVTVAGDTTGTWVTDNGTGIIVYFDLGTGSGSYGTAGSWQAGNALRTAGSVNLISTSGATFYITGVQLEKGSTATSFDYRPYGTELALCQRYYSTGAWACGAAYPSAAGAIARATISFKTTMRATPTVTSTSAAYANAQSINFVSIGVDGAGCEISQAGSAGNYTGAGTYKAEIEL